MPPQAYGWVKFDGHRIECLIVTDNEARRYSIPAYDIWKSHTAESIAGIPPTVEEASEMTDAG